MTNVTWLKIGDRSWDPWVLKNLGAIIGWCLQHTEAESYFSNGIFRCIFFIECHCVFIEISLKFVPKGPVDNTYLLYLLMTQHHIGNKSLPEPMMIQFTDGYMRHPVSVSIPVNPAIRTGWACNLVMLTDYIISDVMIVIRDQPFLLNSASMWCQCHGFTQPFQHNFYALNEFKHLSIG